MAQRHHHFGGVWVTDLDVHVLVGLPLHNRRESQVCGQFDDPGQLRDLAVVLILVGRVVRDGERIRRRRRATPRDRVVARPVEHRSHQTDRVIRSVADPSIVDPPREGFDLCVDLFAFVSGDREVVRDVRFESFVGKAGDRAGDDQARRYEQSRADRECRWFLSHCCFSFSALSPTNVITPQLTCESLRGFSRLSMGQSRRSRNHAKNLSQAAANPDPLP